MVILRLSVIVLLIHLTLVCRKGVSHFDVRVCLCVCVCACVYVCVYIMPIVRNCVTLRPRSTARTRSMWVGVCVCVFVHSADGFRHHLFPHTHTIFALHSI